MKTLKLVLDIKEKGIELPKEHEGKPANKIVTEIIKNICLMSGGPRGLTEADRLLFYKVSDAFAVAVKEKAESVKLEDEWMGFIRKCKREATFTPDLLSRRIEELIDAVQDR